MCELMGLCLNRPASAHFSIREFGNRDTQNLDGWGLAWYPDRSATIIKEPVSWRASKHTGFLETYHDLLSHIYIAHVRHKTVGGKPTHSDTHPFGREYGGRDYVFAHNGTLTDLPERFPLARYAPIGVTDSEYGFCYLLQRIARRGCHLADARGFRWLHKELKTLNADGKFNCLLSDGYSLFAYHDRMGYKGLTWGTVRMPGHQEGRFEDSDLQLTVESDHRITGLIIATHPLGKMDWHPFEPGELIVVQNGVLKYSSHRQLAMQGSVE